jgi:hypothetical protein
MRYFLLVGILLLSLTCAAAIYMQKDANGNISYSDVPTADATRVDVQPVATTAFTPAPSVTPAPKSKNPAADKAGTATNTPSTAETHASYTAFFISSPLEEQTFQRRLYRKGIVFNFR